ncbi:MAG: hypothetical protein KatS3mg009_1617 [Acidimicrobiia bacterium]|nr:MAG: hypothetical protein KatS3mg009_1617 [Acidimicrobiia bacterium]
MTGRAVAATRTCCVWCPDWPVVAHRRRTPALVGVPVVVRERVGARDVVRAASAEARAEGVRRGMRRREAEARCPAAVVVDADPALEARAFEAVARAVERITPRVVLDRPGRCSFPTRGPSRYFGGDDALAARVRAGVSAVLGGAGDVRVGIADGVFAAALAARRDAVVPPGGSAAFLAPWPVAVLFGDDDGGGDGRAQLLVRLGLRTVGDVAALSRGAVVARFGAPGEGFHRLARGEDAGPPVLVTPPPDLVEHVVLDPPAARVDVAAFAAKGLADRLLARLSARGLACTRVVVEAETEHGERLARCWRHDGALTPAALAERVRWQLDGWLAAAGGPRGEGAEGVDDTTGGLTGLRLVPDEVVPAGGRQLGFWGGDQAARDRADRVLARVQGMLGPEAVVTAVVQGGRTPAEQVRWVPWGEPREPERPPAAGTPVPGGAEAPGWPGALPPPYPARVFVPPVAAQLLDAAGRPVTVGGRGEQSAAPATLRSAVLPGGGGPVRAWAGPWAHDVRWWDPRARRRRALWQVVVATAAAGDVACLVAVERGAAGVEALYD